MVPFSFIQNKESIEKVGQKKTIFLDQGISLILENIMPSFRKWLNVTAYKSFSAPSCWRNCNINNRFFMR